MEFKASLISRIFKDSISSNLLNRLMLWTNYKKIRQNFFKSSVGQKKVLQYCPSFKSGWLAEQMFAAVPLSLRKCVSNFQTEKSPLLGRR